MEKQEYYKSPEKNPETTIEKLQKLEEIAELADFESGIAMAEQYVKTGFMKPLGDMTEEAMLELAQTTPEGIRAESIPQQSRVANETHRVYKITKNLEQNLPILDKILQEEEDRCKTIEENKKEGYESLTQEGILKALGTLSREEISKYKRDNNLSDEMIKSVNNSDDNEARATQRYYEIIN